MMYLGKSIALVVVLLISTTCLADISVGALPAAVTLSDLNGDGKSDLVTANLLKGAVIVLFGNGDGMFRAERSFGTGSGPWSVVVGDLNGDGKSDLVIADHGDNTVSVLIGNGNGTFQAKHAFGTGGGPKSVAVGDFNGDGVKDMVTANGTSNTASVLLGAGLTPFWATWPSRRGAGLAVGDPVSDTGLHVLRKVFRQLWTENSWTVLGLLLLMMLMIFSPLSTQTVSFKGS